MTNDFSSYVEYVSSNIYILWRNLMINEKTGEVVVLPDFPFSNPGCEVADVLELYTDEYGFKRKRVKSQFNIKELIESKAVSASLARVKLAIMEMCPEGANINPGLLNGINTEVYPQNLQEIFERMDNAAKAYDTLDDSVKSYFNDANDFARAVASGTVKQRIIDGATAKAESVAEIKKEGE